jgi:hypothetical protein
VGAGRATVAFADGEALFASIMAGASGYVLKQIRDGEMVRGIRTVGSGQSLLDPSVTAAVLRCAEVPPEGTTPRRGRPCFEKQVYARSTSASTLKATSQPGSPAGGDHRPCLLAAWIRNLDLCLLTTRGWLWRR